MITKSSVFHPTPGATPISLGMEKTALQVSNSGLDKRDRRGQSTGGYRMDLLPNQAERAKVEAACPDAGSELLTLIIAQVRVPQVA